MQKEDKVLQNLRLSHCSDEEVALDEIKNIELRQEQLNLLTNNILNLRNPNKFDVYDFEPAWGKTTEVKRILLEYKRKNIEKRDLWVTERKDDCKELEAEINGLFKNTSIKAKAIIGRVPFKKRKSILEKFDIVIITHERYRRLSRKSNEEERMYFQFNRHLLVIDEHLDMSKIISFGIGKNGILRSKVFNIMGEKRD